MAICCCFRRPSPTQLWVGTTVIRACLVIMLAIFAFALCSKLSGIEFEHNGRSCAVLNYTIGVESEMVFGGGTLLDINLGSYNFTLLEIAKQFGNGTEKWCAGPFEAGTSEGFPVKGLIYMVSVWALLKLILLVRDFCEAKNQFEDVKSPPEMTIYWTLNEYFVMTVFVSRFLGPFQSIVIAPGRPELMMIDLWEVPSVFCPYREGSLADSCLSWSYQVLVLAQFCRCGEVWWKKRTRMQSQESWKWHSPSLLIWPFPRRFTVCFLEWFQRHFPNASAWLTRCVPWLKSEKIVYLVVKALKLFFVIALLYVPLFIHMMHFGFHFSWRLWFGATFRFTAHWPKFQISMMICILQVLTCILWLLETVSAVGVVLKLWALWHTEFKKRTLSGVPAAKIGSDTQV